MYKAFYIINTVFFLHVSATLVAILTEVCYKGWILQDITNICEPMHKCKLLRILLSNVHLVISIICNTPPWGLQYKRQKRVGRILYLQYTAILYTCVHIVVSLPYLISVLPQM
jgi:hypothetical protein